MGAGVVIVKELVVIFSIDSNLTQNTTLHLGHVLLKAEEEFLFCLLLLLLHVLFSHD